MVMEKISRILSRPTDNDRGNAVAIVLMVLAVVSLLGVGLLTQSRIDMKFVTSFKNHNTTFNLADGAASLALTRVSFSMAPAYDGNPAPTLLNATYATPQPVRASGDPSGSALSDRGTYWPLMIFRGPITDPTKMGGWELGKEGRALECWIAQGSGKRRDQRFTGTSTTGTSTGVATSNADIRKGRHLPTESSVQVATNKRPPM
jgi:hypothetical protein